MDLRGKGIVIIAVIAFLISTMYFTAAKQSFVLAELIPNEERLGELCIRHVTAAARIEKKADEDTGKNEVEGLELSAENENPEDQENDDNEIDKDTILNKKLTDDPLVIIYHTHSSESYMP
ncbi:MAG: stage II sporulation protein P, partial [Firmicutes bacterium]|nr:stage II sporulation protein P [Bacillota bacterium]